MDRHLAREMRRAHKQEVRAERKEAKLHGKAMNQALHGNLGRAAVLEARANNMHHKAEHAHVREQAATAAMMNNHGYHHHGHMHVPPPVCVHPSAAPGYSVAYTETTVNYPVGTAYPPSAGAYPPPPAGAYPPPQPPGYTPGYTQYPKY